MVHPLPGPPHRSRHHGRRGDVLPAADRRRRAVRHHVRSRRRDVVHGDDRRPHRPHHPRRGGHGVRAAGRGRLPLRDHHGPGRRTVVHAERRELDRPHRRRRRHRRAPPAHGRRRTGRHRRRRPCGLVHRDPGGPDRQDRARRPDHGVPLPDRSAKPHAIVAAADGEYWFTEWGTGRVGRITETGEITEHALPDPSCEPHGITVGPDGALWSALETGGVARVERLP